MAYGFAALHSQSCLIFVMKKEMVEGTLDFKKCDIAANLGLSLFFVCLSLKPCHWVMILNCFFFVDVELYLDCSRPTMRRYVDA